MERILKVVLVFGLLTFLCFPLNAFSWSYKEAAQPYKGVTIRYITEDTPINLALKEIAIDSFEKETGIKVAWERYPFSILKQKCEMDLFSKAGYYDCMKMYSFMTAMWINGGHVLGLDKFLKNPKLSNPKLGLEDFSQPIWDKMTLKRGSRIGLVYYNYAPIYYGRKDLLNHPAEKEAFKKKYGYDMAPAKTWDQVRDIAEFFTRKKGETLAGEVLADNFYGIVLMGKRHESTNMIWMDWVYTFGGSLLDKNNVPTINSQENIAATEFWKSLWKFSPPGTAEYDYVDILMSLLQGIAAQTINWADFAFPLEIPGKSKLAGRMAYGPIPVDPKHQIGAAIVEGVVPIISSYSKSKEATFLFLQWLSEKQIELKVAQMGLASPVRKAVWKDPSLTSSPFAAIYSAMKESLDNCVLVYGDPNFLGWPMINDYLSITLSEIGTGKKTVKEGLDAAQKEALRVMIPKK